MQDEPLARREADPEPPLLPPHLAALDLEARALGLDDLERPHIVAKRADLVRPVRAGRLRDGDVAGVLDAQHLHRV